MANFLCRARARMKSGAHRQLEIEPKPYRRGCRFATQRRGHPCLYGCIAGDVLFWQNQMMDREELLVSLANMIVGRKKEDKPAKVGIDGRCGAGKSILTNELAAVLIQRGFDVLRPTVDGFHHPLEHRYRQGEYSAQ